MRVRSRRLRLAPLGLVVVVVVFSLAAGSSRGATVVSAFSAGTYPRAIAVDEATGRVFVTHQVAGAGTSVFDANGAPAGTLAAGTFGAVVDPATNRVYVTESGDRTLRAYDLDSLARVASVPVGPFPYAVAVNSSTNRIYVASQSGDGIYVVNGQTASVITNIPISGWPPYGVAVNPNTNRVYATGINGGSVSVIDGATNSVATTISVGSQPNAVAVDPQTNRIYVANQGSNTVSVIDGTSNSVVDTIPVGAGPQAIAVNASLNRIYVANTDDNTLSVIDGANDQVLQTIPVGAVPIGVAVNNSTDRVYVTNLQGNTVTILDDSPPPQSFVTRDGTKLLLGGQPFRPVGLNIYNANSNGTCWYQMDGSILDDSLAAIGSGSNTMRAWFFQNLATANGARDWTAFDRTLATARAHGYKVIATLGNQWADCDQGYGYKNTSWYQSGYTQPDPAGTVSYRDWVQEIVSRYQNDPTILAWQLLNEPEVLPYNGADCTAVPESTAESLLYSFASDVSGLIKSIDPNHLLSLGTIGSGQCGAQYTDYKQVMSIPTLDLCEFHDYTPSQPIPGDQFNGLQFRIDQCSDLNKPLLVGELGVKPSDVGGTLADRANTVASKLCAQFGAGVAGELLWAWDKDGSTLDNYDIGPGDPVLGVLGPWSDPTHTCAPRDTTPPVVTGVADRPPDAGPWYRSPVTIHWTASDPDDPSVPTPPDTVASTEGANVSYTSAPSCDAAGNCATGSFTISLDQTAPTSTCAAADGTWHASDVSLACTSHDGLSGLARSGDAGFSVSTDVAAGTETANASTGSRTICDVAGNCVTAGAITGNKVDKKPPQVTLTTPGIGSVYVYRQPVVPSFACPDGGSGTAAPGFCTGSPLVGGNVATTTPGAQTFTVTARDAVGNAATPVSHGYSVRFNFTGFYAPLKNQPAYVNVVQSGRGVPVLFSLRDYAGTSIYGTFGLSIFTGSSPSSAAIACPSATKNTVNQTTTASGLHYNSATGQYEYDWPTSTSWKGTCRALTLKLKDGSTQVVNFQFK
jgi:YVTN family beta-propeller protein